MSLRRALDQAPLFGEFTSEERDAVAGAMELETHVDGDVLFEDGDRGDGIYLVVSGEVAVSRTRQSETTQLAVMGEGEVFGLVALLDEGPRSATVHAKGEAQVAWLSHVAFEQLTAESDELGMKFDELVSRQLARDTRNLNARLVAAMLADAETDAGSLSGDFNI